MLLSELTKKAVYSGQNLRGVCLGIGISLKSQTVKYLLCASMRATGENTKTIEKDDVDFAAGIRQARRHVHLAHCGQGLLAGRRQGAPHVRQGALHLLQVPQYQAD